MKSTYHTRKFRKCLYCEKERKRNISNGRNKGFNRTCGSKECLQFAYKNPEVLSKKIPIKTERVCSHCSALFVIRGWVQRWCLTCVPDKSSRARMRRYGISAPAFASMLLKQGGLCGICKTREATCLDHCHTTGKNRLVLCDKCNLGLHFIEDIEWAEKAKQYVCEQSATGISPCTS